MGGHGRNPKKSVGEGGAMGKKKTAVTYKQRWDEGETNKSD